MAQDAPGTDSRTASAAESADSVPKLVSELWELVLAYFKQETLQPLRRLVRFVLIGVPGAVLTATGTAVLLLAALRLLQVRTGGTFRGHMSPLPYVITAATGVAVAGAAVAAILAGRSRRARG